MPQAPQSHARHAHAKGPPAHGIPAEAFLPEFAVRVVAAADQPQIEALHDRMFGPGALARTAYRVREGTPPVSPFCRVAEHAGRIIAAIRFTPITIGGTPGAVMLGPLAVDTAYANQGHGRRLIIEGLAAANAAGIGLALLVGDEPYYGRLGFVRVPAGRIVMPGPVDPARLLSAELAAGALARLAGEVSGIREPRPLCGEQRIG